MSFITYLVDAPEARLTNAPDKTKPHDKLNENKYFTGFRTGCRTAGGPTGLQVGREQIKQRKLQSGERKARKGSGDFARQQTGASCKAKEFISLTYSI